jgi:hypothetical protein
MKTIDQNPTVADKILFNFKTTDENNYLIDPYKVESIKIYFVERDYSSTEQKEYTYDVNSEVYKINIIGNLTKGSRVFRCSDTTNLSTEMAVSGLGVKELSTISYINDSTSVTLSSPATDTVVDSSTTFTSISDAYSYSDSFYYKNANCIKTIGDSVYPAWLSTDLDNAFISKSNGVGIFEYIWDPVGMREGDYFVCWSWIPKIGQDLFSNNIKFSLKSSNFTSTSSPAHHTKPNKYETLLDRYLPEVYKMKMSDDDRSPDVLQKFNQSVAEIFTLTEDIGNQLVDLLDANGVSEHIITYLSNTLDVRLKSQDPTLWRRQVKEAISLYKKKGTLSSVKDALSQAGMRFLGIQNYWQIISPYFYQDSFFYTENDVSSAKVEFTLSKRAVNVNDSTFKFYLTKYNSEVSDEQLFENISVENNEYGETIVTLSESYPKLEKGDIVRFSYYYKIPSTTQEQNIDDYIKSLPILDSRNEKEITNGESVLTLPLKNWNARLIAENDPFINTVISSRHPFVKNLIFGKIRTEFPYSENVYNMEEYNGSFRDSNNPCDIDKDFLDPCSYCRSSIFDIDVEVEKLSNDSVTEIRNILTENTPFHSYPKTINLYGGQNEFVTPPIEDYDIIINYRIYEDVIAGAAQQWFYRNKLINEFKLRSDMASSSSVYSGSMTFLNEKIILFSEDIDIRNIPISENCVLEITSGINAGDYAVVGRSGNYLEVDGVLEPLNTAIFNFKLYNVLFNNSVDITRDDVLELSDNTLSFGKDFEINNNYKIKINLNGNDYNLDIKEILPNNKLLLKNNSNIITNNLTNKVYSILDENLNTIASSSGTFLHSYRSYVSLSDYNILFKNDNNYLFFNIGGTNYFCKIISYSESQNLAYIDTYDGLNAGAVSVEIRQMLTPSSYGYFSYSGLKAVSDENLEQILEITNGINNTINYPTSANSFKEDFAILLKTYDDDPYITLNSNNNYYFISEIDSSTIWISGLFENFGVEVGTQVEVEIFKLTKNETQIKESYLNCMSPEPTQCPDDKNTINISVDRSGKEIVTSKISGVVAFMEQKEAIAFEILTINGNKEKGKL